MVHVTETYDEERPHLVTHVETRPVIICEVTTRKAHQALVDKELPPDHHLATDAAINFARVNS